MVYANWPHSDSLSHRSVSFSEKVQLRADRADRAVGCGKASKYIAVASTAWSLSRVVYLQCIMIQQRLETYWIGSRQKRKMMTVAGLFIRFMTDPDLNWYFTGVVAVI